MKNQYPTPLRLGIIGCGGYAFELIKRVDSLPRHLKLVAATSRNPRSASALACESMGVSIFQELEALLEFAPGRIDAIINPSPIHVHSETTLKCLQAGFPVWLEKPPVATLKELDALLTASAQTGKSIDVCFNALYSHNVQRLKAELVANVYGKIRRVRGVAGLIRTEAYFTRNEWAGKLRLGDQWVYDGTINNPLAHLLCNNLYLAAPEHNALAHAESVEAWLWHANRIESEDTSSLRIWTPEGVEILSHLTLCSKEIIEPLTVIDAEKATISLRNFSKVDVAWHDGRKESRDSYTENRMTMLEELAIRARTGEPPICSLAMCRPFTGLIERSFGQVLEREGAIPAVHISGLHLSEHGDSTAVAIEGMNVALMEAHDCGSTEPMTRLLGEGRASNMNVSSAPDYPVIVSS